MARIAIGLGVLLVLLGIGGYLGTGRESFTALIPAVFGVPMAVLGVIGLRRGWRRYAMHAALVLALLGVAGTARGAVKLPALIAGDELERPAAVAVQSTMCLLCVVFLILAVGSFIRARRAPADAAPE